MGLLLLRKDGKFEVSRCNVSHQISAVPYICCIVTRRLIESVGGDMVMPQAFLRAAVSQCDNEIPN